MVRPGPPRAGAMSNPDSVILEEEIDENYEPSQEGASEPGRRGGAPRAAAGARSRLGPAPVPPARLSSPRPIFFSRDGDANGVVPPTDPPPPSRFPPRPSGSDAPPPPPPLRSRPAIAPRGFAETPLPPPGGLRRDRGLREMARPGPGGGEGSALDRARGPQGAPPGTLEAVQDAGDGGHLLLQLPDGRLRVGAPVRRVLQEPVRQGEGQPRGAAKEGKNRRCSEPSRRGRVRRPPGAVGGEPDPDPEPAQQTRAPPRVPHRPRAPRHRRERRPLDDARRRAVGARSPRRVGRPSPGRGGRARAPRRGPFDGSLRGERRLAR